MKKVKENKTKENLLNPDSVFRKEALKVWEEYLKYKENKKKEFA